jgi:hypothetical protein
MQILITLQRNSKELYATVKANGVDESVKMSLRSITRVRAVDLWIRDRCGGMSQADQATGIITRPEYHVLEDSTMMKVFLYALLDGMVHEAMRDWNNARRK